MLYLLVTWNLNLEAYLFMIGVFDSGLGGLTVLKEIRKLLPEYDYTYLGDTLHVPYGNRSDEAIFELTKNACDYMFNNGCKLIIIACNTASARALGRLQTEYLPVVLRQAQHDKVNILGVIRPVAEAVAKNTTEKVGVIGTKVTINSKVYMVELNKQQEMKVEQQACPLLVPMIEENWLKRKEIKSVLRYYLRPLKNAQVKTLILGCTHYPLLLKEIRASMGRNVWVPNPGEIVAKSLQDYLQRHPEINKNLHKSGKAKYLVTDLNEGFQQIAQRFISQKIKIEKIKIN